MEIVITSAVRTPVGKFEGSLKLFSAPQLGSLVIREALKRSTLEPSKVDEVIIGNVLSAGLGQNPCRQAALYAGLPKNVGCTTINKVCGSGLKAVMLAAQAIKAKDAEIVVAGGMESMTRAPYALDRARAGYRLGDGKLIDLMIYDGLWDVYNNFHMGITGERIADRYKLTREELDSFALRSHQLAAKATREGKFKAEILPLELQQKKASPIIFDKDEGIRENTSLEALLKLPPVFKSNGKITAGNASQISDGASALVVMSAEKAEELKIKPLARIISYHTSGVEPENVMEAPIPTIRELLEKTGLTIKELDLIEHNEAFASASVAIQKEFEIPASKFNVNGGAIALGHPIGASGARVLTTLIYALHERNKKRGLAVLCLGGGNAVAMIIERF
jgi:acetyl-CoA C-acetyltransferase